MTNQQNLSITLAITAIAVTSFIILSSWDFKQPFSIISEHVTTDTIPKKSGGEIKEKKIRDLDEAIDELNNIDLQVNMEKIQKEISDAMKKIDGDKIKMEIEKAMKEIDVVKIQKEVESSFNAVDWKKIQSEIDEEIKKIDVDKIKQEVDASMKKIDWTKMKAELEKIKETDMKKLDMDMIKLEKELSKIGPEIERSMEKAKAGLKEYNDFVDELEKDGLLNRKEGYTIKHKNGELIINDKKASSATYNKYRSFLEKHNKFTIAKSDDDFSINLD
jgi:hypothetical protein